MKCDNVKFFLPTLNFQDIEAMEWADIKNHLEDCSSCKSLFENSQKVKKVLQIKKYEIPDEFVFRSYLSDFHRRLLVEIVRKKTFWQKICEVMMPEGVRGFRVAFSYAAAVGVFIFGLFWMISFAVQNEGERMVAEGFRKQTVSTTDAMGYREVVSSPTHLVVTRDNSGKNEVYVMDRVDFKPSNRHALLEF